MKEREIRVFNLLLPIWLLVFCPSYLWLVLIPANYLLDRIILKRSVGAMPDKGLFCRRHTWKICLAGFLSDLAGALLLLGIALPLESISGDGTTFPEKAADGIMFDPFSNILAFTAVAAAVGLSAVCIRYLDERILKKAGLEPEQARRAAIRMAVFTAPYLYFLPTRLLYEGGAVGF